MGLITRFQAWKLSQTSGPAKAARMGDRIQKLDEEGKLAGDLLNADGTAVATVGDDQTPAEFVGNLTGDSEGDHAGPVALGDGDAIDAGTSSLARSGNNIVATLPTSDPQVAGALYVTGGAVLVSAGT